MFSYERLHGMVVGEHRQPCYITAMPARTTPVRRTQAPVRKRRPVRPIADPQLRLVRVLDALEAHYGVPTWEGPKDALEVMVLTVLSQNTTDANALRAYEALCRSFPRHGTTQATPWRDQHAVARREDGSIDPVAIRLAQAAGAFFAPDWAAILKADPKAVQQVIRPAGLPHSKGPTIQRVLAWLVKRCGAFRLEEAIAGMDAHAAVQLLSTLKGVGVKTAAVTLIEASGADLCPVDTHVHRIVHRLELVQGTSTPATTYARLQAVIPPGRGFSLHHNLLTFGRSICTAKKPACSDCFLARLCPWPEKPVVAAK